jgi:hypothetical protein
MDGWMGDTALIGRKCIQDFGWENMLLSEGVNIYRMSEKDCTLF